MNNTNKPIIHHATGKKKTSVASVFISNAEKPSFTINDRNANEYLDANSLMIALSPFVTSNTSYENFSIVVKAHGGGISSQGFAIRHGISQIIAKLSNETKSIVKSLGFLTRDARIVERKKPGLRKARRKEQFSKR